MDIALFSSTVFSTNLSRLISYKNLRPKLKKPKKGAITYLKGSNCSGMESVYPRKVNYEEYKNAFNSALLKDFEEGRLRGFDTEKMRGMIYGYTFTEDYKKGVIPDTLSMDYWKEKEKDRFAKVNKKILHDAYSALSLPEYLGQGVLIWDTIMSTGAGTIEEPYCVICVQQEYEFLRRLCVFGPIKIIGQQLLPGHIDCIDIEEFGQPQSVYFDISRWFERDKDRKDPSLSNEA